MESGTVEKVFVNVKENKTMIVLYGTYNIKEGQSLHRFFIQSLKAQELEIEMYKNKLKRINMIATEDEWEYLQ